MHIGPHKTGTTYIQETLSALRDALLNRGICFPSVWDAEPGIPSHLKLALATGSGDLSEVQRQVQEILARNYPYVVISSEDLSRLGHDGIVRLSQLFSAVPIEIVYYVRRWPERMPSQWQEGIKFGRTATFTEYLAEQLTQYDTSVLWDVNLIDRFARVFGAARIKLVSYSYLADNQLDIARHFLAAFLGVSDMELPPAGRFNQSLPILDTEIIRALNSIHARRGGTRSTAVRAWYLAHKEGLVPNLVHDAMRDNTGKIRLDENMAPFNGLSRNLAARYAASIVPPSLAGHPHELRAVDVPLIHQNYLLEPAVPRILNDIYETFLQAHQSMIASS